MFSTGSIFTSVHKSCWCRFVSRKTGVTHASVPISGVSGVNSEFSEINITVSSVDNYFKARGREFNASLHEWFVKM